MSDSSNARCANCEAGNTECDWTRGSVGCRNCVKASIECGSHPDVEYTNSYIGLLSAEINSSIPSINNHGHNLESLRQSLPSHRQYPNPYPLNHQVSPYSTASIGGLPPALIEGTSRWPHAGGSIVLVQVDSKSGLADEAPIQHLVPGSSAMKQVSSPGLSLEPEKESEPVDNRIGYLDDDPENPECPEKIQQSIRDRLVLDEHVESNTLLYLTYSAASWMNRFLFEPTRAIRGTKSPIIRWLKHDTRQVIVAANVGLNVSRSTDYDLTDFVTWEKIVVEEILQARERGVAGPDAIEALRHCHKFISTLTRVGSLASVLRAMNLFAPIFRLACPESSNEYANLPRILIGNINLQCYAAFDVLQSVVTHRPMFFRYRLEFLSPWDEELVNAEDGLGFKLRWLYGIPDRLIITLARMNTLLEDFGNRIDSEVVNSLEKEIEASVRVVWSSSGVNPLRALARILVDESWKFAAYAYLYMGLCGADARDKRVVEVQKKFMRLLEGVEPRRNPDVFLILPIVILGMATSDPEEQSILLVRLSGVSECNRFGTMGNDLLRMLKDVWAQTTDRPAVWSDLRIASSRITGM